MPTTKTATDEELQHEADRLMAEHLAVLAERQRRAEEAASHRSAEQTAWRQRLLDAAPHIEESLEKETTEHFHAAEQALAAGDLAGAWQHWVTYNITHRTRARIRTAAQSAADVLGKPQHIAAELRQDRGSFLEFLTTHEVPNFEAGIDEQITALIGEMPT